MGLSESRETASPLCGLEGRLDHILGQHPLGDFLLRVCKLLANADLFDPNILQVETPSLVRRRES